MINDKLKLIEIKIQKALKTLEDSMFLIENNKLIFSVNRIYYSIFYAISALAEKHNFETSRHAQLLGWFNNEFVMKKKIDKKIGKTAHKLFDQRTKADYDILSEFSENQVRKMYDDSKVLINKIIDLINS